MIEILEGVRETVNFKDDLSIMIYDNCLMEDYPVHWHMPLEVLYILENDYRAICNGTEYRLHEGDILFICPCILHELFAPPKGRRLIIQFSLSPISSLSLVDTILAMLSPSTLLTRENAPELYPVVAELLSDISLEYSNSSSFTELSIYAKVIELLALIGRQFTDNRSNFDLRPTKQMEYADKFLTICDYINRHFAESLTLEDIAAIAGFSKYHFSRLFKQFTGQSFYQYLNNRRISQAEFMLAEPGITVTEVALRSGFSNISAFIRMFKLHKNCTPSEFRALYTAAKEE